MSAEQDKQRSDQDKQRPFSYSSYLMLDELLALQRERSDPPEHDEKLFIIIHQVYELWFKLLLHEIEKIDSDLRQNRLYGAIATFKRMRMVMKTLVSQLDVLETMTPMSFDSFRDRLESASGFQSVQFRELEFVLGHKRPQMVEHHAYHPENYGKLQERLEHPSVIDALYRFLQHRGFEIPAELLERDLRQPNEPHPAVQNALLDVYRRQPDAAILLELMTDFDEGLQEWRYRHVKMVERTIGAKSGTGGSSGAAFLRETLFKPVFPDLWAIRHRL